MLLASEVTWDAVTCMLRAARELRYAERTCFDRTWFESMVYRTCLKNMEQTYANGPMIEFRDVAYLLPNGQPLLAGLNLQVERGETLVLLGRSGSGKTTSLKLINRLLTPTSGEVRV